MPQRFPQLKGISLSVSGDTVSGCMFASASSPSVTILAPTARSLPLCSRWRAGYLLNLGQLSKGCTELSNGQILGCVILRLGLLWPEANFTQPRPHLFCHPCNVQGSCSEWPTGNGKKLSNSQSCCLAQMCLAGA